MKTMKITKYAQSCFLLETEKKKILIDPGELVSSKSIENFENIDFILYTHIHNDHCFPEYLQKIIQKNNLTILTNGEVAEKLTGFKVTVMRDEEVKKIGKVEIQMIKVVHGFLPRMKTGGFPKQANGFIVRDQKTSVLHCGDTICFPHNYKTDLVLVPVCGHGVVMEPLVAVEFCMDINPKLTIPMHYDSDKHPQGTELFERFAKEKGLKYKVLKPGESVEL